MITAILGPPNAGKTTLARQQVGACILPLYFLRIAAHRECRVDLYEPNWYDELLAPERFMVKLQGYVPKGETWLIRDFFGGHTADQQPEADLNLVKMILAEIRRRWSDHRIVAEGEILSKRAWLDVVDPDQTILMLHHPRSGCVRRQRTRGIHPPASWSDDDYFCAQLRAHGTVRSWLEEANAKAQRRKDAERPWNQPNERGEGPGDICCQRSMGGCCHEHNPANHPPSS